MRTPWTDRETAPEDGDTTHAFDHGGYRLSVAGGTRVGNRYPANFDVLHVDAGMPFVAVADGMGGGRGSTAAGTTTMSTLVPAVRAAVGAPEAPRSFGPAALRAAVAEAQARVRTAGEQLGELTGCTLTALVVAPPGPSGPQLAGTPGGLPRPAGSPEVEPADVGPHAWIAQIGDSRAYRLRNGLLELLTVDHTAAWFGAIYGWYPADSAEAASARYQLTRYVGHPDAPEPDVLNVSLRPGDVYCVCSDGITEQVDYARLAHRLGAATEPIRIVRDLLADSLAAGGQDNATVALLRVEPIQPR